MHATADKFFGTPVDFGSIEMQSANTWGLSHDDLLVLRESEARSEERAAAAEKACQMVTGASSKPRRYRNTKTAVDLSERLIVEAPNAQGERLLWDFDTLTYVGKA